MDKTYFRGLTGDIVTPESPEYDSARQEWNRAINKFPLVIVYCNNRYDVQNAIRWAEHRNVQVRIRSGGHNYEGYSVGDGVLVIDISRMNRIFLDASRNLLSVEGGATNEQIYDYVSSKGYPFPGGTCPTVAVSGLALGGGWGLSCRNFGLACDSLTQIEMIDYRGHLLIANCYCNSDLFWACRGGGGGNFGVIVSMTFSLPPKVYKVTLAEIYYPDTDTCEQAEFIKIWQKFFEYADRRITLIASIYNDESDGRAVYCRGIFYGTPDEAAKILKPFGAIKSAQFDYHYLTFLQAITRIGESYPDSQKFKSTGRFVQRKYRDEELVNIATLVDNRPEGSVYTAITLYALGGKVAERSRSDTAFYYRSSRYIMGIQSVWVASQFARQNVAWVNERFQYLKSITKGSYVNFPYSKLRNYLEEYYGDNVYYLELVNRKYDPYNFFKFPQSLYSGERMPSDGYLYSYSG